MLKTFPTTKWVKTHASRKVSKLVIRSKSLSSILILKGWAGPKNIFIIIEWKIYSVNVQAFRDSCYFEYNAGHS